MDDLTALILEVQKRRVAGRLPARKPAAPEDVQAAADAFRLVVGEPLPDDLRAFWEQVDGLGMEGNFIDPPAEVAELNAEHHRTTGERVFLLGQSNDVTRYIHRPGQGWVLVDFYAWSDVDSTHETFTSMATEVLRTIVADDDYRLELLASDDPTYVPPFPG